MTRFPKAWASANASLAAVIAAKSPTKVESRIDMGEDIVGQGKCPECKKTMTVASMGAQKVWVCAADRITLPMPNQNG